MPVEAAGFLQNVMDNFAALLGGNTVFIGRINVLIINGRNVEHVPGNFQIRAHARVERGIVITGMAGNLAQFVSRNLSRFNQALLIGDQAAGIVIF